jgi:hypothetical protein
LILKGLLVKSLFFNELREILFLLSLAALGTPLPRSFGIKDLGAGSARSLKLKGARVRYLFLNELRMLLASWFDSPHGAGAPTLGSWLGGRALAIYCGDTFIIGEGVKDFDVLGAPGSRPSFGR